MLEKNSKVHDLKKEFKREDEWSKRVNTEPQQVEWIIDDKFIKEP